MPYRQNEDNILGFEILIERDVTGLASRDHHLAHVLLGGTTNQRMAHEDFQALE